LTSRACSTEYRLKHPCGKAAGVLCRICTVLVLLCRGGRLCPPCMTAAPCRAGPMCPAVTGVGIRLSSPPSAREVSARSADGGRDATRFLYPSRLCRQPPPRGGLTARRCRAAAQRPIANTGGKNCQIRHFAQISRRMLADVPKFRKLREITCKRHAAVVHLHYTS
jgi:hypothetical protein